jgi:16S rRNA (guanine(966)-N(2))-methyltransferase RsmD
VRQPARPPGARPAGAGGARAPQQVRIIGGTWRRTPIAVADVPDLRPSPDRVRETLFNWLAHLRPDMPRLRGLDLFAGTGALGFELASRGAARVVLVERQPQVLQGLRALQSRLDAKQVEIVAGDALAVAAGLPRASFDVVFLDPPFGAGLLWPAIDAVRPLLADGGLIYAEADAPIAPAEAAAQGLEVLRSARAGRVCFHLLQVRNA